MDKEEALKIANRYIEVLSNKYVILKGIYVWFLCKGNKS